VPTAIELRELDDEELEDRLLEYRRELLNLRFQLATGQLDNYSRLGEARHNVARVLQILRDREIALAEGRPAGPVFLERPARPPRRRDEDEDVAEFDEADDDVIDEADEMGDDEINDELEDDASFGTRTRRRSDG
jgi:large subunit ribosomal protein L29